jgi:amino acid transporter
MISRSLGIEPGGAIGIPLFFAQALSVALYTVGFAESVVQVFPDLAEKWVAIITTLLIALIALGSAKAAIKAQYVIMIGIALSLISLAFGSPIEESHIEMWGAKSENSAGFWTVFAVFFPAVTGIMAGVNMSGDLKDPKKSIPKGTFAAIGVGYLIYMILPILLANRADALTLIEDPLIMRKMAFWGDAILIGVWGATLSSALGSILGAPRVLQALAKDGILPKILGFLGKGSGIDDTPRAGTIFTLAIVLVAVWLGDLNLIAPILSMFFLTTYGVLNISAGTERFLRSPSFRPTFRVHWLISFIGAFGCIAVMLLINSLATVVALLFVALIYIWLKRRQMQSAWGDIGRGIRMALIKASLLRLTEDLEPKSWRPNPMVLAGAPTKRWHLIEFADTITQNRGILTIASAIPRKNTSQEQLSLMKRHIHQFLTKKGVQGLVKIIRTDTVFEGLSNLVEHYGMGALQANTIILGASEKEADRSMFCQMISRFNELKKNVLIINKDDQEMTFGKKQRIDVWWGGLKGNGGLMIILAYLINSSIEWRQAKVCLKMVVDDTNAVDQSRKNLESIIEEMRINFDIQVIVSEGRSFTQILKAESQGADLIFMGMASPDENFEHYFSQVQERISGLPTTVLALAAQEIAFSDILIQKDSMKSS